MSARSNSFSASRQRALSHESGLRYDDDRRWYQILGRRVTGLLLFAVGFVLCVGLSPVLLLLSALVDIWRRGLFGFYSRTRCFIFLLAYLWMELFVVLLCALIWLFSGNWTRLISCRRRFNRWNRSLNACLQKTTWGFMTAIFNIRLDVEPLPFDGQPCIVFMRHTSTVDGLVAQVLASRAGYTPRFVMKAELLWDPLFDIMGQRLGNCFVVRGGGANSRDKQIRAVQQLLTHLGTNDMVVIYPEGTRLTPKKRLDIQAKLQAKPIKDWEDSVMAAAASRLQHHLPPQMGGALALLDRNMADNVGADVVFLAHLGMEGAGTVGSVLAGRFLNTTVTMKAFHVKNADIPREHSKQVEWMLEHWDKMDKWVGEQISASTSKTAQTTTTKQHQP